MKTKLIIIGLAALFCAGCATQPVSTSEAKDIQRSQILAPRFTVNQTGFGEVVVKRDKGFMGSACSSRVFVDGEAVADIRPGEKVVLFLSPGEHIIGSKPNGICGGGGAEVSITTSAARTISLRIRYENSGDYAIQPTAF